MASGQQPLARHQLGGPREYDQIGQSCQSIAAAADGFDAGAVSRVHQSGMDACLAPHANQVVEFAPAIWTFNAIEVHVGHAGAGPIRVPVDPCPGFGHDLALVEKELDYLQHVAPLPFPIKVAVMDRELLGRTNAQYHELFDWSDREHGKRVGVILLSGKRIPMHPAITRYLVAHEYGHAVEDWIRTERGGPKALETDFRRDYMSACRPTASDTSYGPLHWPDNVGELFANDFRLQVTFREEEYWPHPGHEPYPSAVTAWWSAAIAECWRPPLAPPAAALAGA